MKPNKTTRSAGVRTTITFAKIVLPLALGGCASMDMSENSDFGEAPKDEDGRGSIGSPKPEPAPPGEEQEVESLYEAPIATGHSIWVANPRSGRVAFIDAESLSVSTVEAGNGPTRLAAVPGLASEAVIVINERSNDATLIERTSEGARTRSFPIAAQANAWSVAPSGRFAVAWADARLWPGSPETEGFQELTVLDTSLPADDPARSTVLAVGYRPLQIGFDTAESKAYAVTQDGVLLIDLAHGRPKLLGNVALGDDPLEDPLTRDVVVTPDGAYALVRRDGVARVDVLRLADGQRASVSLPAAVSDLDLDLDGDRAVAVLRATSQVAVLPVPAIFDAPTDYQLIDVSVGATVASVVLSPVTDLALLFTNATPVKALTIMPLASPTDLRTVRLYSAVLGVFPTPSGRDAVVLHRSLEDGGGAFSLVRLTESLPARIADTDAPPFSVAVTDDFAVVTERDDGKKVYAANVSNLGTLAVERFTLASPPLAAGVISDLRRAYVSQAHPDGRITFIDFDTGVSRTLTGFELGARVVNGAQGKGVSP